MNKIEEIIAFRHGFKIKTFLRLRNKFGPLCPKFDSVVLRVCSNPSCIVPFKLNIF